PASWAATRSCAAGTRATPATASPSKLKNHRIPPLDQGLPELLIDLQERGLLETTLVVWLTDFGRTPKINSAGGRDHWASAGFALMAGAGIPGGAVLGRTDGEGGRPTPKEYF